MALGNRVRRSIKRRYYDFEDRWFERRHKLDLNRQVALEDMQQIDRNDSFDHAKAYQAIPCWVLRQLLREAQKNGENFDAFIDIGSGKGKPCFYARLHADFKQSIGVEFSPELLAVAQANLAQLGVDRIQFVQSDAAQYRLPDSRCFVFLYNPFDEFLLQQFARNNLAHFKAQRSVIAYANDYHRNALEALGFSAIYRNAGSRLSLYRLG